MMLRALEAEVASSFSTLTTTSKTTRKTEATTLYLRPIPISGFRSLITPRLPSSCLPLRPLRCRSGDEQAQGSEEEEEEEWAREAVADVLREAGASAEDASRIAASCPAYLDVLMKGVREVDELGLWSSWADGDAGAEGSGREPGFREKVYSMAKRKGDRGVIPFLESIGVRGRSEAARVAGYVSSLGLADLIAKVNYLKEILADGSGFEAWTARNARRMMMQLAIPIDEDLQQTLSFFEKLEAKGGGLDMLGVADTCLPFLIKSFPRLLLRSGDKHLRPLFEFLRSIGVPSNHIRIVVLLFPPVLFYDVKMDMEPMIQFLQKVGVQDQDFAKVLLKYPWILSRGIQENYEDVRRYLQSEKVPKACIDRAVRRWPHILGGSTTKMKLVVGMLHHLGIKNKTLAAVIVSSPQLLLRKQSELNEVVNFLEELGLESVAIGQILRRCPEILASDTENTLKKKVSLLTNFVNSSRHPESARSAASPEALSENSAQQSLPMNRPSLVQRVIKKYPELLSSDVNDNLFPRLLYLMELGLSKHDVISMVYRFSPLLGYSIENVLRPKIEFLLKVMKKPLKEVVEYPRYFSYSLEKKIKRRYYFLRGRNNHFISLEDMLGKNDEQFAECYMGVERVLVPPTSTTISKPAR